MSDPSNSAVDSVFSETPDGSYADPARDHDHEPYVDAQVTEPGAVPQKGNSKLVILAGFIGVVALSVVGGGIYYKVSRPNGDAYAQMEEKGSTSRAVVSRPSDLAVPAGGEINMFGSTGASTATATTSATVAMTPTVPAAVEPVAAISGAAGPATNPAMTAPATAASASLAALVTPSVAVTQGKQEPPVPPNQSVSSKPEMSDARKAAKAAEVPRNERKEVRVPQYTASPKATARAPVAAKAPRQARATAKRVAKASSLAASDSLRSDETLLSTATTAFANARILAFWPQSGEHAQAWIAVPSVKNSKEQRFAVREGDQITGVKVLKVLPSTGEVKLDGATLTLR